MVSRINHYHVVTVRTHALLVTHIPIDFYVC